MSYNALKKMREENKEKYLTDIGPIEPYLFNSDNKYGFKASALRFLHNSCENLKFDEQIENEENRTHKYQGTSLKKNQIPYNMQMDINRLCLERNLEQFMDSGSAEDAYLVYYCFLEIFTGHYGKSKKMIELLSEFEANGSSLLMKHRDHYSHSVYVFALGLAIFETNENYRKTFAEYYEKNTDKCFSQEELANEFLEYWGLASLFHDIGYPFELPFEQVMSYFEVNSQGRGEKNPYISYRNIDSLTSLYEEETALFNEIYGREFKSVNEVFAHNIYQKLGSYYDFSEEYILNIISSKSVEPSQFGFYMDHAFFSSIRLYRELVNSMSILKITEKHIDALTAILLHNSMFKFSISSKGSANGEKRPLKPQLHPLAWLLMLCDELQCWDRTAYGRNSRTELHPMSAEFDFSDNSVSAIYYYDKEEHDKIDNYEKKYKEWVKDGKKGDAPRLKAYSDMASEEQRFTCNIESIIDISDIPLTVATDMRHVDRKNKRIFLSSSNFLHLYDFAVSLHGRNSAPDTPMEELEKRFEDLSLEYQLSTINRAKNFSRYLDAIQCFYTDRFVDYEMVTEFSPEQTEIFAPMEHERWIREHQMMGWKYGTLYETAELPDEIKEEKPEIIKFFIQSRREQMRCHKLAMDGELTSEEIKAHYQSLSEADQGKDWKPFNTMLRLLKKFDGIRIYHLN